MHTRVAGLLSKKKKKKKDDRVVITACVLKGNIIFILATAY